MSIKSFFRIHFPSLFGPNPLPSIGYITHRQEAEALRLANDGLHEELRVARDRGHELENWKIAATPVLNGLVNSIAKRIHESYVQENGARVEAGEADRKTGNSNSGPDAKHFRDLRETKLTEAGRLLATRIQQIDQLVKLVLAHKLDETLVFSIPREQIREWVIRRAERGELINGKIGTEEVSWAQDLLAYGVSTQTGQIVAPAPRDPTPEA